MAYESLWGKGAIRVSALPEGEKSFLFRFHEDENYIPGNVVSNCLVVEQDEYVAEVQAWGGRRGPTTADRVAIREFCMWRGYNEVFWWRYKNGKEPYKVWLYHKIAY